MTELNPIRPARRSDTTELTRLTVELGYPAAVKDIDKRLDFLLASENHFLAVAPGREGELLGWVIVELRVSLESGDKAEISGLVVTAQARRSGVGRQLVLAAEQWARQRGMPSIGVRSNIARMESHGFYQAMNYGRRKTQHCYEKQLSPN
jgi:GNAT superfamily N-acetyltransferase